MKTIATLGLAATIAAVSTAAFAADLPNRKKAPAAIVAPSAFSWNGVYAGLNGGYVTANDRGANAGNVSGGAFGLTAGYNMQLPNNVVVGVEGDYDMTNADASGSNSGELPSAMTLRARAGLAMDRALPYITAGYAGADIKTDIGGSKTSYSNGWAAGGGVEYALTNNFSAKAEALYISLDKVKTATPGSSVGYDGGLYRVGLNYHF